ncbi:hypothetical protein OROGR_008497 [Orobanche gracilis]
MEQQTVPSNVDQVKWRVNAPTQEKVIYPIMARKFQWSIIPQKVVMMTQLYGENDCIWYHYRDNGILLVVLDQGDSCEFLQ